ncbi:hypothetical protein CHS0354_006910 [Potamilus streckersoni]|uniref:Zinc ABC transporter substrate-binding protein n=1 Tax=Potamilus streckersoni TaxID=2493646 RepID=A0AAE0TF67_9BIVA|nr:hypothetical protein CHS0354_006910 [Potamilus streckersoni]
MTLKHRKITPIFKFGVSIFVLIGFFPALVAASVSVTIKPLHSLTVSLTAGTGISVHLIVYGRNSPHTKLLKPSHLRQLKVSELVIMTDDKTLEIFIEKADQVLDKKTKRLSVASKLTGLLEVRDDGDYVHEEEHADEQGHGGKQYDPHIWNSVSLMRQATDVIEAELVSVYSAHAAKIKENAKVLKASLEKLKQETDLKIKAVQSKPFVVFHDAYQYFEQEFGLHSEGVMYYNPVAQMSARHYKEIQDRIRKKKYSVYFL